uniref:Centrosomal protein of 85 kDa-like n=1 Tax=Diabrotica virgifera virgifera TaxID=50390 RepID=A0A6P7H440_DIAVI
METGKKELSDLEKLLQLMQIQSQKMYEAKRTMDRNQEESKRTMDENQRETKRVVEENQEETKQAIEENNRNLENIKKEMVKKIEEIVEKCEKHEIEIKEIKIKMKEVTNCQKKEIENLENKLENAIQADIKEVERKIKENERKIVDINTQQNFRERREMVIHSTDDVKIRFGGDVRRLHPVPFINSLKKKVQHIGNFETVKETIRNHLKYEAGLWFDSKEEEFDSWQQFEQKILNCFWGKVQQMEINKELQNGRYNDRIEQLVELIARHFEETLEDHITLQNYKDVDSLCQFLQRRESRLRERKSRTSQED